MRRLVEGLAVLLCAAIGSTVGAAWGRSCYQPSICIVDQVNGGCLPAVRDCQLDGGVTFGATFVAIAVGIVGVVALRRLQRVRAAR